MVHQYKLGGYNIVLDICSGAMHVVDEVAYDIIELYENESKETVIAKMTEKYEGKDGITKEDIEALGIQVSIANAVTDTLKENEIAISPGMKYRHYAPEAPVILLDGTKEAIADFIKEKSNKDERIAIIAYEDDVEHISTIAPGVDVYRFGARGDEATQAHLLFKLLRDKDKMNYSVIYAPLPEKSGIGLALYNRMIRAAAHNIIRL